MMPGWIGRMLKEMKEKRVEDDLSDRNPPYYTSGKNIESFEEFRMIKGFSFDADYPEEGGLFFDELEMKSKYENFRESFSFYHEGGEYIVRFLHLKKGICG